jgi:ABC-type dipeptide/oligopeptide/nickel transport system permease subunit
VATVPGIVIVIVALAFNFVGEGLREALNPRARQ